MKRWEYDISLHSMETFKQAAMFCTQDGTCQMEDVPMEQVQVLSDLLNERGREGWQLIQVSFGRGGLMAFWKRKVK